MYYYAGETASGLKYLLNSGSNMPAVGLSTYRSRSEQAVHNIIDMALDNGYRLFDTSPLFCNETALRNAFSNLLPRHHLEREDIFIVSKLIALGTDERNTIRGSFEQTLANLGLDYIDLLLISSSLESSVNLKSAWETLKTLQHEGYVTSIGVANFSLQQLRYIMEDSSVPSVNQVEWHPYRRSRDLLMFCDEHHIRLQAHSPFGTPLANYKLLFENGLIRKLSAKYDVPPSQILLMWSLQQGVAVLPSSTDQSHIRENIDFDLKLTARDIEKITKLRRDTDASDGNLSSEV